jgi:aryl-alcohol dehydrogenase-like predicted oxidoreductase
VYPASRRHARRVALRSSALEEVESPCLRSAELERFVSTQPPYSIFTREMEREVFPVCRAHGFGAIVWSPLEGGWLSGRYRKGQPVPEDSRSKNATEFGAFVARQFDMTTERAARRLEVVEALAGMADGLGVPLARYATAWTLVHPAVTSAIIGPRTMTQLEGLLAACDVRIPAEQLERMTRSPPHERIGRPRAAQVVREDTTARLSGLLGGRCAGRPSIECDGLSAPRKAASRLRARDRRNRIA